MHPKLSMLILLFSVSSASCQDLTHQIDATQVRLLPGSPFHRFQELHRRGYVANMDPDELLFEFRKAAGLPQKEGSKGYGGWDGEFLRGHLIGHYLSAASRLAATSGDLTYRAKANYIVSELAKCQAALGDNGYLAAFHESVFDALEGRGDRSEGVVVPYYIVHKIMSGLVDAYHYIGNRDALVIATRMADYFHARLATLPPGTLERMFRTDASANPQNEFGAMAEVLVQLFEETGDRRFLAEAAIFNRTWFSQPLASNTDRLKGLHANTHIAQVLGLARYANRTGDATTRLASENFWSIVTAQHSFVIGGNSFKEWFDAPGVETGPCLDGGARLPPTTAESCNTHNMLRLTSLLQERDPERSTYAEFRERALYNHLLATIAPDTGAMTYFLPLRGNFRTYLKGTFCCVGSGMENTARYEEGIYFERGDELWISLYIPSTLDWKSQGLRLRLEGSIPYAREAKLTVTEAGTPLPRSLHFRIPAWVASPCTLSVNGVNQPGPLEPGSFACIRRVWKTGDSVVLTLPAKLRLEKAHDDSTMVSVFYGPLLLGGHLGTGGMPADLADKDANLKLPSVPVPEIQAQSSNPEEWLVLEDAKTLRFRAKAAGPASGVSFEPLYQIHHERYSVYWILKELRTQ